MWMKVSWFSKTASEKREYVRKQDFASVFERERVGLQRLALLLTANPEAVKPCLLRAFRECTASNSVSMKWALSWARRVVIRNAISLVTGLGESSFVNTNDAEDGVISFPQDDLPSVIEESKSILELPELDRLVFVICILERYSTYDCALLLDRSHPDIIETRQRVGNYLGQISELKDIAQRFATH